MLTGQLPTLLALLGTGLMAVVIFAPAPAAAKVTASFAPPLEPVPLERCGPDRDVFAARSDDLPEWGATMEHLTPLKPPLHPAWPALLDARAVGCDAAARLELVGALTAIRTPWSDDVLRCALAEESDPLVRDAIAAGVAMS